MLMLVTALLLATSVLGNFEHHFPMEPEDMVITNSFMVQRPSVYLECPPRAVCGVAFDFNRTRNGVSTPERRVIRHCTCPGNLECPVTPEHRVFASVRTREYLCRPLSSLQTCEIGNRRRPAKELVVNSPEFDHYNYNRVNCRCPRHTRPKIPKRRGMQLATSLVRVRFDWGRHMSFHERYCIVE